VVRDTTCPLVRKAHNALALLVAEGYHPVIIGQAGHAEVSGLAGDFPQAEIVLDEAAICRLSVHARIGIVSQTTQPIAKVQWLVSRIQEQFPQSEVVYKDTVCQPTKDRQAALESLCRVNEVIIVIGGKHSNNTRQLSLTVERLGATAYQIERASELQTLWFQGVQRVGVTAGTSTLQETVHEVVQALERIASS
jgi:4-hydroxy-3-methylbut-2-en-1-yl diphosphate reductase